MTVYRPPAGWDHMSAWKKAAAQRRDARNIRDERRRDKNRAARKKDTRKWCNGVTGRQHTLKCVVYKDFKRSTIGEHWRLLVCTECRKELDCYTPSLVSRPRVARPKPAWVDC